MKSLAGAIANLKTMGRAFFNSFSTSWISQHVEFNSSWRVPADFGSQACNSKCRSCLAMEILKRSERSKDVQRITYLAHLGSGSKFKTPRSTDSMVSSKMIQSDGNQLKNHLSDVTGKAKLRALPMVGQIWWSAFHPLAASPPRSQLRRVGIGKWEIKQQVDFQTHVLDRCIQLYPHFWWLFICFYDS